MLVIELKLYDDRCPQHAVSTRSLVDIDTVLKTGDLTPIHNALAKDWHNAIGALFALMKERHHLKERPYGR